MNEIGQNAAVNPSLADASRVVIKIGSALLVDSATGRLNRAWPYLAITWSAGDPNWLRDFSVNSIMWPGCGRK